jgi:hypothetical protein
MSADVLVVDDEVDIRELVAGILEDEGYAVRVAADPTRRWPPCGPASPRCWSWTSGCRAGAWTGWSCSTWSRPWTPTCR